MNNNLQENLSAKYSYTSASFEDFPKIVDDYRDITNSLQDRIKKSAGSERQKLLDLNEEIVSKFSYLKYIYDLDMPRDEAVRKAYRRENTRIFDGFKSLLNEAVGNNPQRVDQPLDNIQPQPLDYLPLQAPDNNIDRGLDELTQQLAKSNEERNLLLDSMKAQIAELTKKIDEIANDRQRKQDMALQPTIETVLAKASSLPQQLLKKLEVAVFINQTNDRARFAERDAILREIAAYDPSKPADEPELVPGEQEVIFDTPDTPPDVSPAVNPLTAPQATVVQQNAPEPTVEPQQNFFDANKKAWDAFEWKLGTLKNVEAYKVRNNDYKVRDEYYMLKDNVSTMASDEFMRRLTVLMNEFQKADTAAFERKSMKDKLGDLSAKPQSDYAYDQPGALPKVEEPKKKGGLFSRI